MKLLRDWELETLEKAREARKYIKKKHIEYINIEDLNKETSDNYSITNLNTFIIKDADGIKDCIFTIKPKWFTYRDEARFAKTRVGIVALTLIYFSEIRWNITEKIKDLLIE